MKSYGALASKKTLTQPMIHCIPFSALNLSNLNTMNWILVSLN